MNKENTSERGLLNFRLFFGVSALLCLVGVSLELYSAYHHKSVLPPNAGFTRTFGPGLDGLFNHFFYFTTQSNIILGITAFLLALNPVRTSDQFHVWRLVGIIDITITCIVFNFVLKNSPRPDQIASLASTIQHSINPALAIVGWLIYGPKGSVSIKRVAIAAFIPIAYAIFTLVRGAILVWYPYNILDVTNLGYGGVSIYIAAIFILFLIIAGFLAAIERWVGPRISTRIE